MLQNTYKEEIIPKLKREYAIKNIMAVPRVEKIVVNAGVGDLTKNKEGLEKATKELAAITGQMPSVRNAKLSVASFGLREGQPVGLKVTLRGKRMYDFLEKLITIVLPRLRDFRGVSLTSFDQHGNYNLGLKNYSVFPEIDVAQSSGRGVEITMVTSTKDKEQSKKLLELLGVPFEKLEEN